MKEKSFSITYQVTIKGIEYNLSILTQQKARKMKNIKTNYKVKKVVTRAVQIMKYQELITLIKTKKLEIILETKEILYSP